MAPDPKIYIKYFNYSEITLWYFQSAYKAGHSCETSLLRLHKGNGAMLISLLLVPFMKEKMIMLCIIDPYTV